MRGLFRNPWWLLLVLVAIPMLVFGIYFATPLYPLNASAAGAGIFSEIINTQLEKVLFGGFYVGVPLYIIFSVFKHKYKMTKIGAFGLFLIYGFAGIARILVVGFLPLTWMFILTLGLVAGLARLVIEPWKSPLQ